jgi:uncharacterized protein YkwD
MACSGGGHERQRPGKTGRRSWRPILAVGLALQASALAIAAWSSPPALATQPACPWAVLRFNPETSGTIPGAVLCALNRARARRHLPRLRLNSRLARAARSHSEDMLRRRYFSHISPSGSTPLLRARQVGYGVGPGSYIRLAGETLGAGYTLLQPPFTPAELVRDWLASPPHRHILLWRSYRDLGVGASFFWAPAGIAVVVTADLGSRTRKRALPQ